MNLKSINYYNPIIDLSKSYIRWPNLSIIVNFALFLHYMVAYLTVYWIFFLKRFLEVFIKTADKFRKMYLHCLIKWGGVTVTKKVGGSLTYEHKMMHWSSNGCGCCTQIKILHGRQSYVYTELLIDTWSSQWGRQSAAALFAGPPISKHY
jgi:hypothetical protein